MKERPILFSGPMVRALLDGRKTQTRRVVKPQPIKNGYHEEHTLCPYGAPGDRLWVRETHAVVLPSKSGNLEYDGARLVESEEHGPVEVWYRADGELGIMANMFSDGPRWIPSIHMRRVYSRLTLEVTEVRVERVQDISETDALEEGITSVRGPQFDKRHWPDYVALRDATPAGDTPPLGPKPSQVFKALWDDINGGPWKCWDDNPWVWVVGFKVVEP